MAALRSISTRQLPTTSFTNHYEWSDLKANPSKLLEKYLDAFVYLANWGTPEPQVPSTNCGGNGVVLEAECPRPRSPRWHS
jgi:hypothetical protein